MRVTRAAGPSPDVDHRAVAEATALTVVYVAYGIDRLNLDWIPGETSVVIVHNDERLATPERPGTVSLRPGANLGFGAGVNRALEVVTTPRVLLCNPDTRLAPAHFTALAGAPPDDVAAVPLVEPDGTPNSVINRYWHPMAFTATALRLGRFAPRGSARRSVLTRSLGRWGRSHRDSLHHVAGSWPLVERWATAAVVAAPTEALRAIGGFDDDYFLYYEDVDLQQRLARRFPTMRVHLLDVEPAIHEVGGSDSGPASPVARHRLHAALTYARRQDGAAWAMAGALVAVAAGWRR